MNELTPFAIDGQEFEPECWLIRVDEPEFGCEGRPDGEPVCGSVVLLDGSGQRTEPIAEDLLFGSRLDDRMWIGRYGGEMALVRRDRVTVLPMNEAERSWWQRHRK